MIAIIATIMAALSLLLQWLSFRKQKNGTLTAEQKVHMGHCMARMQKCIRLGEEMGCVPQDDGLQAVACDNDDLFPEGF